MCSRQVDFWTEFPCCEGRLPVEQPAWKTCLRAAIWRRSGECHLPDDRSGCPRNTAWSWNKGPGSTNKKKPLGPSAAVWMTEYMYMCCRALTAAACPRSTSIEAFCVSDPGRPKPQPLESCLPNLHQVLRRTHGEELLCRGSLHFDGRGGEKVACTGCCLRTECPNHAGQLPSSWR